MLNPHKVTYYCEKRDPDFEKKTDSVCLWWRAGTSYDEKPGIQAVATTSEDRPPVANTEKMSTVQRDYEYKRLGALSHKCELKQKMSKKYALKEN